MAGRKRREKALNIIRKLKKQYPEAATSLTYGNPLELLVATILSAQCTDITVNKVTPALFRKYRSAAAYSGADLRVLRRLIRPIGLHRDKARNIRAAARRIENDFGGRVPESMEGLTSLPGVGRKTANIVLSNAFGKNEGIAVDTHVKRVSGRLGLTGHDAPDKIETGLMAALPKRYWGIFNHLLVLHGRAVCRAKDPRHEVCVIRRHCDWYKKHVEEL